MSYCLPQGDFQRIVYDDAPHLTSEQLKFIATRSAERWMDCRKVDVYPGMDANKDIFHIGAGEIDAAIEQAERKINDMALPAGMDPFDLAAFTDRFIGDKVRLRWRIGELQKIKARIKSRCLNYAILLERQIDGVHKTESFLATMHREVDNYFLAHSDDVYSKLQKASHLVDTNIQEDCSLLLTEVRRAIKAAADFFYPPRATPVICADGQERLLDDDAYLNRFNEYLLTTFPKSSSRDLLRAELHALEVFVRRLNDVASKGVHAEVSSVEAKQGLIGLYGLLFNIVSRL